MNRTNFRNLCVAATVSAFFLLFYNISAFSYSCQTVRDDVVRLHILANSDSQEDQQLKLKVRDAILNECPDLFKNAHSADEAQTVLGSGIDNLKNIAEKTVSENGYDYCVSVYLDEEYFTARSYNEVTLPAGKYNALKIIIGNGKGQNWWCVMFPSVCLPAAEGNSIDSVFNDSQKNLVINTSDYEVRFKIMEYIEMIKYRINNR